MVVVGIKVQYSVKKKTSRNPSDGFKEGIYSKSRPFYRE